MFGTKSRVTPLELRKQLLIVESEINRVRLLEEWQTLADGVLSFADQAASIKTMASSIVPLVAGLVAFTGGKAASVASKSSWLHKVVSGARLASTIWLAFRSRGSHSEKK